MKEERLRAKELLYDYNHLRPDETDKKETLMKKLLGSIGQEFSIGQPFYCDYGYNIHIGSHFYANTGCVMLDCGKITIGNHVFLAPHVQLYTVNHPIHLEQRDADYEYTKPITIKDHVWIAEPRNRFCFLLRERKRKERSFHGTDFQRWRTQLNGSSFQTLRHLQRIRHRQYIHPLLHGRS